MYFVIINQITQIQGCKIGNLVEGTTSLSDFNKQLGEYVTFILSYKGPKPTPDPSGKTNLDPSGKTSPDSNGKTNPDPSRKVCICKFVIFILFIIILSSTIIIICIDQ